MVFKTISGDQRSGEARNNNRLTGEEDGVCKSIEWEAQSKDRVVTDLFYGHERVCVSVPQSHDLSVDRRRYRHYKADLLSSLLS